MSILNITNLTNTPEKWIEDKYLVNLDYYSVVKEWYENK